MYLFSIAGVASLAPVTEELEPPPLAAYSVSPVTGSVGSLAKKTPKGFSGFFEAKPSIYKDRQ